MSDHETAGWRSDFELKLAELTKLPTNSDGWTAHRPSDKMIELARMIVVRIKKNPPSPIVAAATNGTIQMKWQKSDLEVSFFIYPDGTLEYLRRSTYGGRTSGDLDLDRLDELLSGV